MNSVNYVHQASSERFRPQEAVFSDGALRVLGYLARPQTEMRPARPARDPELRTERFEMRGRPPSMFDDLVDTPPEGSLANRLLASSPAWFRSALRPVKYTATRTGRFFVDTARALTLDGSDTLRQLSAVLRNHEDYDLGRMHPHAAYSTQLAAGFVPALMGAAPVYYADSATDIWNRQRESKEYARVKRETEGPGSYGERSDAAAAALAAGASAGSAAVWSLPSAARGGPAWARALTTLGETGLKVWTDSAFGDAMKHEVNPRYSRVSHDVLGEW